MDIRILCPPGRANHTYVGGLGLTWLGTSTTMKRSAAKAAINWNFSTQDARAELHHLYPSNS